METPVADAEGPRLSELVIRLTMAHGRFVAGVRRGLGLGAADYAALRELEMGPLPVGELASRIGLSRPAATALVDRLARQGRIERGADQVDRRRVIVRRAASGQSPAGEPMRALAADIDALAEQLSERERGVVARYLADVAAAVERRSAGALPGAGAAPT